MGQYWFNKSGRYEWARSVGLQDAPFRTIPNLGIFFYN